MLKMRTRGVTELVSKPHKAAKSPRGLWCLDEGPILEAFGEFSILCSQGDGVREGVSCLPATARATFLSGCFSPPRPASNCLLILWGICQLTFLGHVFCLFPTLTPNRGHYLFFSYHGTFWHLLHLIETFLLLTLFPGVQLGDTSGRHSPVFHICRHH